MNILFDWVRQILMIILIGTVLDLIFPNNSMKKYVHLVFGLLLFLVVVQPVFFLFQMNIFDEIEKIEKNIFTGTVYKIQTENVIENQKKELEDKQLAYIWNELRLSYIEQANPVLQNAFAIEITDVQFHLNEEFSQPENFTSITVYIAEIDKEHRAVSKINDVQISLSKEQTHEIKPIETMQIRRVLTHLWDLTEDQDIEVVWEGGTI